MSGPHRLSGSKLSLGATCLYWARADAERAYGSSSGAASLGSAFGTIAEWQINKTGPTGESAVTEAAKKWGIADDQVSTLAGMRLAFLDYWRARHVGSPCAEMAYAFNPSDLDARQLGVGLDRAYTGIVGAEIPMTADVVDVVNSLDGPYLDIIDWKTGRQANTEPAARNWQLRAIAACAARVTNVWRARVALAHVSEERVWEDVAWLDEFELRDIIPAELADMVARVADAVPVPGTHCADKWCPAAGACPATRAAAAELVPETEEHRHLPLVGQSQAITSAAHAASIFHRLKAIGAMYDAAWKAVDEWVDTNGAIPLGDGKEYRRCEETRESIVANATALEVLRTSLGDKVDGAVKTTISKKAIETAARDVAGPGKPGAGLAREVIAHLRARGCVTETSYVSHEMAKVRKGEAAA